MPEAARASSRPAGIHRRLAATMRLALLELRRATGGKAVYLLAGCLVWFAIVALWNALAAEESMEGTSVLNGIVALPSVLLALFLSSQIIASDQENRSLEVVLSLPRGRRALWLLRLAVAVLFSWGVAGMLTVLSWLFVAGFPLGGVWMHSLWPVVFFAAVSFALSVFFRSGTAAALVSSLLLGAMFLTQGAWDGGSLFYLWPFLNPYLPPEELLPEVWWRQVAANRLLVLSLAAALFLAGLAGMRRRERLL